MSLTNKIIDALLNAPDALRHPDGTVWGGLDTSQIASRVGTYTERAHSALTRLEERGLVVKLGHRPTGSLTVWHALADKIQQWRRK